MIIDHHDPVQNELVAKQYVDEMTSGRAPHPESPRGAALSSAYRAWQDRQRSGQVAVAKAAAIAAVQVTSDERKKARKKAARKAARKLKRARAAVALAPEAVEERAQRRSERRMRKMVEARIPGDPLAVGFLTYQKEGGKLSRAAWKRRTAQRTP